MAQLVGTLSCKPKGSGFYSQLRHIPRLRVLSLVRAHMTINQLMFLSHINVYLPLAPCLPSPFSTINGHVLVRIKKKKVGQLLRKSRRIEGMFIFLKMNALTSVVSSCKAKDGQFDSWSGHLPGLQVRSPVGACTTGNQLMFLLLPLFPSL